MSALANLTNLEELWLGLNSISDVSALGNLTKLTYLDLANNKLDNINYNLSNLGTLSNLTKLKILNLTSNAYIQDVSFLAPLANLEELYIGNNRVENLAPLSGLTNLKKLSLGGNILISNISPLAQLTNLTDLDLSYNGKIADIKALMNNPGLGSGDTVYLQTVSPFAVALIPWSQVEYLINVKKVTVIPSDPAKYKQ
jgi:internalin A